MHIHNYPGSRGCLYSTMSQEVLHTLRAQKSVIKAKLHSRSFYLLVLLLKSLSLLLSLKTSSERAANGMTQTLSLVR